jgi:hypothetical protein
MTLVIKKQQNVMILLTLILVLLMPTLLFSAYGQETSPANGQPPVVVNVNPQGGPNATNQHPQNLQAGSTVTDPVVLAIAFVGAASGVIYRTVYPYFERLQDGSKRRRVSQISDKI